MATQTNQPNRTARKNGETTTMTTATIDNVQNGLNETRATIAREEAKLQEMQTQLGIALAAHRMGEKDAQKRAATLSMDLGKLRSSIEVLRSEERALVSRYEAQMAADNADRIATLQTGANALVAEMDETERAFADAMRQVCTLGKRLQEMNREQRTYRVALMADLPEGFRAPRTPGRLFNLDALEQGDVAIDRWLASEMPRHTKPADTDVLAPATKRAPVHSVSHGELTGPVWTRGGE